MSRVLSLARRVPAFGPPTLAEFYKEEFQKISRCVDEQRDGFSELALLEFKAALADVMGRIETLCQQQDCEQVVSELLRRFDKATGLSPWSDPRALH